MNDPKSTRTTDLFHKTVSTSPVSDAIAEYLRLSESGKQPGIDEFLAHYPDIRQELRAFLESQEEFAKLAQPIREMQSALAIRDEVVVDKQVGDYEIIEEIGRGGMGVIYRARQSSLHRIVALKMIHQGRLTSDSDIKRFQQEAKSAASLDHPHIIPVYEVGQSNGDHFFTMRLAEGGNLEESIQSGISPRDAAAIVLQISKAIHHAHQRGILHRDLKPSNILLESKTIDTARIVKTNPGRLRSDVDSNWSSTEIKAFVGDFGLAKQEGFNGELTATGAILGSPNYMSPEQAAGSKGELTVCTDVHGLGGILYATLTGVPPFRGTEIVDVLRQVKEDEPVPPRTLNPIVDRDLETICLRCLEKIPDRRYPSAEEVANELTRFLDGKPIHARPASLVDRTRKWIRREPKLTALMAVSIASILAIIGGLFVANIMLSVEKAATNVALRDLAAEQRRGQRALWNSHRSEARAHRWSGRPGHQRKSLSALEKAIELNSVVNTTAEEIKTLRNELISTLAIPFSLHAEQTWEIEYLNTEPFSWDFDFQKKRYALGRTDGVVSIYLTDDNSKLIDLPAQDSGVCTVQFSPDGNYIAVCHLNRRVYLWDLRPESSDQPIFEWNAEWQSFDFSRDGRTFAIAPSKEKALIFDLDTRQIVRRFGPMRRVLWMRFGPRDEKVALSNDEGVMIVDVEQDEVLWEFSRDGGYYGTDFSQDGNHLAVACPGGHVHEFDLRSGHSKTYHIDGPAGVFADVAYFPNTDYFIAAGWGGAMDKMIFRRGFTRGPVLAVPGFFRRLHPDGQRIAILDRSTRKIGIWSVATSKILPRPAGTQNHVTGVAFSSKIPICATADDKGVHILRNDTMELLQSLPIGRVGCVAFDPTGGALISGGDLGLVRWPVTVSNFGNRVTIGPPTWLETPAGFRSDQCEFSKDGNTFACDGIREAIIFQRGSTNLYRRLAGQQAQNGISLSEDGVFAATGNFKGRDVYVWNVETGETVFKVPANDSATAKFIGNDLLVCDAEVGTQCFSTIDWQRKPIQYQSQWSRVAQDWANNLIAFDTGTNVDLVNAGLDESHTRLSSDTVRSGAQTVKFSPAGNLLGCALGPAGFHVWKIGELTRQLDTRGLGWSGMQVHQRQETPADDYEICVIYANPVAVEGVTYPIDLRPFANTRRAVRLSDFPNVSLAKELSIRNPSFFPSGHDEFAGIPFDIDYKYILLGGRESPLFQQEVNGILVNRKLKKLHLLHGIMWADSAQHGEAIASYTVHYDDESSESFRIVNGVDAVDWLDMRSISNESLNPVGAIAPTPRSTPCHVRVKSWTNPHPEKRVTRIDVSAVHSTAIPFCMAMTGEN